MNLNWLILLIGLAGGALPTWWFTADHYQGVIAKEHVEQQRNVIAQQEENRLALLAYAERITTSGAQHDKDAIVIRNLARERDGLRINFPTCPVSGGTQTSADSGEAGWVLPNPMDALFERLQSRAGILVEECDTLNIDAIRRNAQGVK